MRACRRAVWKAATAVFVALACAASGGCAGGGSDGADGSAAWEEAAGEEVGEMIDGGDAAAGSDVAGEVAAGAAGAGGTAEEGEGVMEAIRVNLEANGEVFVAVLEDNSSARAFAELLEAGPVTVSMRDYGGMEKVGDLGTTLPRNDTPLEVQPGDVILYQGNQITVYYDENAWTLTRLGRVEGADAATLRAALGEGDVEIVFSLA